MRKSTFSFLLLVSGLTVAGCASHQAGTYQDKWGAAPEANETLQIAYADPAARARLLGDAFKAAANDTVTFPFNSAKLDDMAREALDGQAAWLKANPEALMTIVGHTDRVGGEGYNMRLGFRRARAVAAYLTSKGISRKRLLAATSRGEREPVIDTQERERRNRRSVTVVSGTTATGHGFGLDGELAQVIYDRYQDTPDTVQEADASQTDG